MLRRDRWLVTSLRRICAGLLPFAAMLALSAGDASAQFVPENFFDSVPAAGAPAEVEANLLSYNATTDVISAQGRVIMRYSGYRLECDALRYEQGTGAVLCEGNVRIVDPVGTQFTADKVDVTGGMKQAFIESLTLTTIDGARITARDVTVRCRTAQRADGRHLQPLRGLH